MKRKNLIDLEKSKRTREMNQDEEVICLGKDTNEKTEQIRDDKVRLRHNMRARRDVVMC